MTTEHRLVFEPTDIKAARVTCGRCSAVVALPIEGTGKLPMACPSCGVSWNDRITNGSWDEIRNAIESLMTLADRERRVEGSTRARITLAFEIEARP